MEKISCYFIILPARRRHAFGVLAGSTAITNSSCRAFRASETALHSWRQHCSVLMNQAWPKRGCLRGTFGLRNFEIVPLRVFSCQTGGRLDSPHYASSVSSSGVTVSGTAPLWTATTVNTTASGSSLISMSLSFARLRSLTRMVSPTLSPATSTSTLSTSAYG